VYRELSEANPHFRTLDRISPLLRAALLTNEDGGFYLHHGFNTEAIQLAIAANLRSGSFGRGAGTITMQLARNLFLAIAVPCRARRRRWCWHGSSST